jgi:hypothetical protein
MNDCQHAPALSVLVLERTGWLRALGLQGRCFRLAFPALVQQAVPHLHAVLDAAFLGARLHGSFIGVAAVLLRVT